MRAFFLILFQKTNKNTEINNRFWYLNAFENLLFIRKCCVKVLKIGLAQLNKH